MRHRTDRQSEICAQVNKAKMFMGVFSSNLVVVVVTTAYCIASAGQVLGLECAVCLPPDENIPIAKEIRRLFPDDQVTLISCQQANISNENIIKTCPPESSSCHIQKTKEWTAKTCSKIPVDDCKTANRVKYCYCKTNRCNTQESLISSTTTTTVEAITTPTTSVTNSFRTTDEVHRATTTRARPVVVSRSTTLTRAERWLVILCSVFISSK